MWKIFRKYKASKTKTRENKSVKATTNQSPVARFFLIGAGNVGKTTIIKQIQKLCQTSPLTYTEYNDDWSAIIDDALNEDHRKQFIDNIHQNALAATACLLDEIGKLRPLSRAEKDLYNYIDEPATLHTRYVRLTQVYADIIIELLNDERRKHIDDSRLPHNAEYFLDKTKILEICQDCYLPSEDDIIRARSPTSGKREYNFMIMPQTVECQALRLSIHDMGGQIVELTRLPMYMASWMRRSNSPDMNFVLYVASLADFIKPFNDQSTALDEQIRIFKVVCDAKEFADCHICLFLNKADIFQRRSAAQDKWMREYYHDEFKGLRKSRKMNPTTEALDVILTLFRSAYHKTKRRGPDFFVKVTSAIDSKKMDSIFGNIHHHVQELANSNRFDARP